MKQILLPLLVLVMLTTKLFCSYLDPYPSFYLGYPHQKLQQPFGFRFGFGYPETLALSAGISFLN